VKIFPEVGTTDCTVNQKRISPYPLSLTSYQEFQMGSGWRTVGRVIKSPHHSLLNEKGVAPAENEQFLILLNNINSIKTSSELVSNSIVKEKLYLPEIEGPVPLIDISTLFAAQ
jgi:hypothetical protein